jgi:hypothetical protein
VAACLRIKNHRREKRDHRRVLVDAHSDGALEGGVVPLESDEAWLVRIVSADVDEAAEPDVVAGGEVLELPPLGVIRTSNILGAEPVRSRSSSAM